jgi:hypothetical protein
MGQFIGAVPSGTAAGFYFMDMFGTSTGYDFNDTVYIKIAAPGPDTAANDIRLSPVDTNTVVSANNVSVIFKTLEAGSKIINSDPDIFKPITPMIITFPWPGCPAFGPMAYIRFYNANGNYNAAGLPIYDYEDNVYIDLPWTLGCGDGTVNVNDIRLSEQLT